MPTTHPTGYETYIYDHKQYHSVDDDDRQHQGPLHDPKKLPPPECDSHTSPFIMVEPSGAYNSNEVWLRFQGHGITLPRFIAEQLRDALIKVCEKPVIPNSSCT
jgi:hypothetical protein